LKAQESPFLMRPCPHCNCFLLPDENDYWCCGKGSRQHVPWLSLPTELTDLIHENRRRFSDLSRVFNSLFCSAILHAGVGDPGLNYHVRGGPPCMRVSGALYARMMRTEEHCWFLSDCKFPVAYRSLRLREKGIARKIAVILRSNNSVAGQMWNLKPRIHVLHSSEEVAEGSIVFCDDHDKTALCSVYVGPSTLPPPRTLLTTYSAVPAPRGGPEKTGTGRVPRWWIGGPTVMVTVGWWK